MEKRKLRLNSETLRVLSRIEAQRIVGGSDSYNPLDVGCLSRMTSETISETTNSTINNTTNSGDTGGYTATSCPWMSVTCELC
jgi:hypothetical protein